MVGYRRDLDPSGAAPFLTLVTEGGVPGTGFDKVIPSVTCNDLHILTTASGGYVISGSSTDMLYRFRLLETDYFGTPVWQHSLGADVPQASEYYYEQWLTDGSDGGYAVCGFRHFGVIENSSERYILKTDDTGAVVWESSAFGGLGYGVTGRSEGGCIVCGMTAEDYTGNMILAAFNASGSLLWRREPTSGGLVDVFETSDGGIVACGDEYLIKTDAEGNL
jgi:outer membrane protein assembly factor BamB